MKRAEFILATSSMLSASGLRCAAAQEPADEVLFERLTTAPYPHESRARGHLYDKVLYDAAHHYNDSTVGIVVPAHYRPTDAVDCIVHFHGWRNNVAHALTRYQLAAQLIQSRVDAILIVPQGPLDAPDSGFGKLELNEQGFANFMNEVLQRLPIAGIVHANKVGRIVLTAHSGGYGGAGGVLTRGGLNDHISDVILFDSAYGYFEAFANWTVSSPDHHLLSVFTDDTSTGNAALMAMVQGPQPNLYVRLAKEMSLAKLQTRAPTFILTTDVAHDELMQRFDWYQLFLQTTSLQRR
ncbi:MAG: hypothetical protein M3160_02245 [Candidatus Eremiobacteraeota bacterium]|nr:hypothetical protein [Candidatus Eremiobacteraeota bacterium]